MRVLALFLATNTTVGDTAVLILARGGSKGVRLKNLQKVGELTLLARAIRTAKVAGLLDVTVSTDHPLIALEAIRNDANVFHRSHVTATDWAPSIWGAAEFLAFRPEVTILVLIQATSPFIRAAQLRDSIRKFNHPTPFDCIFAVTRSYKLRWRDINGLIYPVNFELAARPRRQDWGGELLETGAFYITRRRLVDEGRFQNNNCTVLEVSSIESIEVDTYRDLEVANALLSFNVRNVEGKK